MLSGRRLLEAIVSKYSHMHVKGGERQLWLKVRGAMAATELGKFKGFEG